MMPFRTTPRTSDASAVAALIDASGFFDAAERDLAVELVTETLSRGADSGYQFVFDDDSDDRLSGYTCFGPIPATRSSFDLYWIAVDPKIQGNGLGGKLLRASEGIARDQGATRMYIDTSGREQYAPTRAFYERMGYHQAACLADFYAPGDARVIFARLL
jgi:GNAT superfamily N-acetyltransferase